MMTRKGSMVQSAVKRDGFLIIGTPRSRVCGRPEEHLGTGAPWRLFHCSACGQDMWISSTARAFASGYRLVPLCEDCALVAAVG